MGRGPGGARGIRTGSGSPAGRSSPPGRLPFAAARGVPGAGPSMLYTNPTCAGAQHGTAARPALPTRPRPKARSAFSAAFCKVGRSQLYSRGKWVSKCPSNVTRVEAASGWEEHLRVYKSGARGTPRGGVQSLYLHHKSLSAQLSCEE